MNWNDLSYPDKRSRIESACPISVDGEEFDSQEEMWATERGQIHSLARREWVHEKRQREEARKMQEQYENSRGPELGFFKCPNCGLTTGEFTADVPKPTEDNFEKENPPEFITSFKSGFGGTQELCECPECGHETSQKSFTKAWTNEHGSIPEPDIPGPLPGETASGLHKQAERAARNKSNRRRR